MKRTILTCLILCVLIPISIEAKKKPFGNGLFWEISDNGILTISGSGRIPDYSDFKNWKFPWHNGKSVHTIIIEEGITYIGSHAFSNNVNTHLPNVREIFLPSSLIEIGMAGFGNLNVKTIHFKEGLERIGAYAFELCNIDCLVIPKSVKKIDHCAFVRCKNLKSIEIPNTVVTIEEDVFGDGI